MPRQTKMQKMKGLWNASLALGCVLLVGLGIYGLGTINPVTSAQSNDSRLTVQGIDNIVQYLKEMEIYDPHDPTKKVVIGWDDTFGGVVIKGDVNMESIVVRAPGDANTAPNSNEAESSTVIGGTGNRVEVSTDADTNKNLAIVAGAGNSINNAGNAFVAGGSSVRVQNASNAAVVAASESSIAGDQPKGQVAIIAGNKNTIDGAAINNTVIFAGEGNSTSASNTVLIGKNIHARNNQNIFAWSDGDQSFNPTHPNAFYVNATHGNLGVNTANPQVKADINGPLGIKTYELAALPSINPAWRGTMVTVSKHGKTGLCGWDGAKWVPLSLSAKQFAVCVQDVNMPPLPANTISNGKTKLPPLWNPAGNGAWETPQWIYHQRLGDGEYRCNKGYHIGNADPDGKVVAKNCVACSPIANQHGWTSDGKNNDCAFTCKASFKHNASARTCTACADGTYTTAGNTDSTCKSCTGLPTNAHWTSNGTSETSCSWACNPGYYNTGTACVKLEWKRDTQGTTQCKVGGIMYEAVNTKHARCMAGENQVDESHCLNAGLRKPSSVTTTVYGEGCNTNVKCKLPTTSDQCDEAGWCGSKQSASVSCQYQRYKSDNTRELATHTGTVTCTRPCEDASCGSANGGSFTNKPSTNLCSQESSLTSPGVRDAGATVYDNKWSWTCHRKDSDSNCTANAPRPAANCVAGTHSGYSVPAFNHGTTQTVTKTDSTKPVNGKTVYTATASCNNGTVTITGESSSKSCNTDYTLNNSTGLCDPTCRGTDYKPVPSKSVNGTLHNGYCAKWSCESTSSATAGSCSGNYTSGGRCYKQGHNWDEAGVEASAQCHTQTQERCENVVELKYYEGNDENSPSLWGYGRVEHAPGFPIIKAPSLADAGSLTSNSYQMECMGIYNPDPKANLCKTARYIRSTSIYVPGGSPEVYSIYTVTPRGCKRENGGSQSCAGPTTESDCKAKSSSCTRTPGSSSSSSLKCYRQGTTAAVADSECATLTKPSCINSPAPKVINGQCKHYPGKHYPQPAGSTANGCLAGDYIDTADTNTYWKWECRGKNGGSIDSCNAEKKVPINGKCSTSKDSCVSGQFTITVIRDDPDPYGSYQGRCILEELSCNGLYGGTDEYCGESFTGPTSC